MIAVKILWGILKKNDLIHEIKFVGQFVEFLKANEYDKGLTDSQEVFLWDARKRMKIEAIYNGLWTVCFFFFSAEQTASSLSCSFLIQNNVISPANLWSCA